MREGVREKRDGRLNVKDEGRSIIDVCNMKCILNRTRVGNVWCVAGNPVGRLPLHTT